MFGHLASIHLLKKEENPPSIAKKVINNSVFEKLNMLDTKYPTEQNVKFSEAHDADFSFDNLNIEFPALSNDNRNRAEAKATLSKIVGEGKWVDSFSGEDIQSLPVGIQHTISDMVY